MSKRLRLPSPALVVAIVALVVALTGTAVAAHVLISSSSQIRNGAVTGLDVRNKSLRGGDLMDRTVGLRQLRGDVRSAIGGSVSGTSATEVVRANGPVQSAENGGNAVVATLRGLAAGTYFISAKTVIASASPEQKGLLDAVLNSETRNVKCILDAAGNDDQSLGTIITPGSKSPANLKMQLTRSVATTFDVTLRCESDTAWSAGGTSIVAVRLGSSTRQAVEG